MPPGGRIITIDGDIAVTLRRNARARRMTLRVSRSGGEVVLTLPPRASEADGAAFALSRAGWIRGAQAAMPAAQAAVFGAAGPRRAPDAGFLTAGVARGFLGFGAGFSGFGSGLSGCGASGVADPISGSSVIGDRPVSGGNGAGR